jgi:hypothetical protein
MAWWIIAATALAAHAISAAVFATALALSRRANSNGWKSETIHQYDDVSSLM